MTDQPTRLYRSRTNRKLFGVLGGLGKRFNVDPTTIRLAYVFGTFCTAFVPGTLVYLTMALIIPRER
ncbi:MAG: PspC domain-containing protein [Chloroflexi bacterium]|nr:PspC domain-containing protein [Chloroflexota bacterium]